MKLITTNLYKSNLRKFNIFLIGLFVVISFTGCSSEKKEYVDTPFDREIVPSMITDSVTELISDSGLIRYKLITSKWIVYENSSKPHWFFPEKLYLEQFDTAFNIQAILTADTVWNYTTQQLWKLKGNVVVRNLQDETFKSEELFWDVRSGRVYSDKYIEIVRPEKLTLKGTGFESNQQMTQYRIFKVHDSNVYFEENTQSTPDTE